VVLVVGDHGRDPDRLRAALGERDLEPAFARDLREAGTQTRRRTPVAVLLFGTGDPGAARACVTLRDPGGFEGAVILAAVRADDEAELERLYAAGATGVFDIEASDAFVAHTLAFALRGDVDPSVLAGPAAKIAERLAGLQGAPAFRKRVEAAMAQARVDGSCIAVLRVDVDRFQELAAGIEYRAAGALLLAVAERIGRGLRGSDTLMNSIHDRAPSMTRAEGGGFSILLEGLERPEVAAKVAQRLLDVIAEPFELGGEELAVSANVGIAAFPRAAKNAQDLIHCAEAAMHSARQQGRDTLRFYDAEMNSKVFERLTLESNLRHALERDELVVYYQPRVEITSGRLLSFEALVRWRHPELGLVSPAQFIPLAEETGLIVPIGEWVLATACRQNREWQNGGLPAVSVSVNLSSVQFRKPDLYDTVVRVLGESGLDPMWLELELTESLLMQNADSVVDTLKRFRSAGIQLSIDDFGTGYSSLSYLKRFPIDTLKIDREFIREVTTNADDAALATSIILMGRSLKLRVVAEGVETESQLSFLRIMQCDEAQGFLYSPPVPAAEATAMLREGLVRPDAA